MNMIIDEIYDLYRDSFPRASRSKEAVLAVLRDGSNRVLESRNGGQLAGVSVINQNTVYLLCVDRAFRRQGVGTDLLRRSEEHVAANGYGKITVGAGKDYIAPGIPMTHGHHRFFIHRGYTHAWGDCKCCDLSMNLKDFRAQTCDSGGITYRWATLADLPGIEKCVRDAEPNFVRFYQNKELYKGGAGSAVLIAETNHEVGGALIVELGNEGVGGVGCTATAHPYRNRGIATNLVLLGTKRLQDSGLQKAFIGYTYSGVLDLYGRAGYQVETDYFMGEKVL